MNHFNISLYLFIILILTCTFSCAQKSETTLDGIYEYVIPNPKPSNIVIGELIIEDDFKRSPEITEKIRIMDSLKKYDPRYSKVYISIKNGEIIVYRSGYGLATNYKKKGRLLYTGPYPTYELRKQTKDTLFVFDRRNKANALLIKSKDDISDLEYGGIEK